MSLAPRLLQTVLDAPDARALAEFYRQLYDLRYRPGDEMPTEGRPDERDWLVLMDRDGSRRLAFQQVPTQRRPTWPDPEVPQQLHLDTVVATRDELEAARHRAVELGATLLQDRSDDPEEPLYVLADPAGHPLCIFVSGGAQTGDDTAPATGGPPCADTTIEEA